MKYPYLTVSYREGRFQAAYLCIATPKGDRRVRTKRLSPSVLLDIDENEQPVGIEILSLESLTLEELNRLLRPFGVEPIEQKSIEPLLAVQKSAAH